MNNILYRCWFRVH